MKSSRIITMLIISLTIFFGSCKKDAPEPVKPTNPGTGTPQRPSDPGTPDNTMFLLRVKAAITVGNVLYDSIPATITVRSWDVNNVVHERQVQLNAGMNNLVLPQAHTRFQFTMSKWGLASEVTILRSEIDENTIVVLGGTKAGRKLKAVETFRQVSGVFQPDSKTAYTYRADGSLERMDYFQKLPQYQDLQFIRYAIHNYENSMVKEILNYNAEGQSTGFTLFERDINGRIVNMHNKSYDQETYAYVQYGALVLTPSVDIDYLFSNGNAMEYKMKFNGGNKVEESALSSTGGGEGGTFSYDFNINPYALMNIPDLYLRNLSKNNLVGQQKTYSGSIPSAVPYHYEYVYDAEGYPVELQTSFKTYSTGVHLYTIKTVFTY